MFFHDFSRNLTKHRRAVINYSENLVKIRRLRGGSERSAVNVTFYSVSRDYDYDTLVAELHVLAAI